MLSTFVSMKVGLFFGSFNPIHTGHMIIANIVLETTDVEQIWFVVSPQNPFKKNKSLLSEYNRIDMVREAIYDDYKFRASEVEFDMPKPSYTVDTLDQIRSENPDADIFLIIGSDSLASFGKWHEPERLLNLVSLAVVQRGGEPSVDFSVLYGLASPEIVQECKQSVIDMPVIELSSTELRNRIAEGRSIRFRLPRPVEALIEANHLYI